MDVTVPDIGDFSDVPVISILVGVGDTVAAEDPLIELESDKATMEVPSPVPGKVTAIKVSEGDRVSRGSVILVLEGAASEEAVEALRTRLLAQPRHRLQPRRPARRRVRASIMQRSLFWDPGQGVHGCLQGGGSG